MDRTVELTWLPSLVQRFSHGTRFSTDQSAQCQCRSFGSCRFRQNQSWFGQIWSISFISWNLSQSFESDQKHGRFRQKSAKPRAWYNAWFGIFHAQPSSARTFNGLVLFCRMIIFSRKARNWLRCPAVNTGWLSWTCFAHSHDYWGSTDHRRHDSCDRHYERNSNANCWGMMLIYSHRGLTLRSASWSAKLCTQIKLSYWTRLISCLVKTKMS